MAALIEHDQLCLQVYSIMGRKTKWLLQHEATLTADVHYSKLLVLQARQSNTVFEYVSSVNKPKCIT